MYTVEGLEHAIVQAKKNIKVFEDAIDKELESIKQWRHMIQEADRKNAEREAVKKIEGNNHDGENRCNT